MPDYRTQLTDDPIEILLVEDNPGDVRLIREAFEGVDHETVFHPITNGDEAVDWLTEPVTHESASVPDMALLDLNLPGRDGDEVLKAIRAHSQLETLPVIMLTSSSAREDVERCYTASANAYLTKPTDPSDFQALAENVEQFWFKHAILPPVLA